MTYNQQNIDRAIEWAKAVEVVVGGGTEILPSLRFIYAQPLAPGAQRIIFILTDGEVYNIQECKGIVQRHASTTRVFSFGIGHGASTDLVRSLARISGGMSEMVLHDQDQLSTKVISALEAATMSDTSRVAFSWIHDGGKLIMSSPSKISLNAFKGRAMGQYAVFERNGTLEGSVRLLGNISGQIIDYDENFTIPETLFTDKSVPIPLHYLAAKSRLTELSDRYHASENPQVKEQLRMEAERLSVESGVVCSFTALVAVDTSGHVVQGTPIHVGIPRGTVYSTSAPSSNIAVTPVPAIHPAGLPMGIPACISGYFCASKSTPNFTIVSSLQTVDGSWKLSQDLIDSINVSNIRTRNEAIDVVKQIIKEALPRDHGITGISRKTVATIIAVTYYRHNNLILGQFIERKGVDFLTQQNGLNSEYVEAILTKAKELIHFN